MAYDYHTMKNVNNKLESDFEWKFYNSIYLK